MCGVIVPKLNLKRRHGVLPEDVHGSADGLDIDGLCCHVGLRTDRHNLLNNAHEFTGVPAGRVRVWHPGIGQLLPRDCG